MALDSKKGHSQKSALSPFLVPEQMRHALFLGRQKPYTPFKILRVMKDTILDEFELDTATFPAIYKFREDLSVQDFIPWYLENQGQIEERLKKHGALVFSEIGINSVETFADVTNNIGSDFMSYVDGFSPRTKLTSNVYTSTEYDKDFYITLHNELSYSSVWPKKLIFACVQTAASGGETPLADCRAVLAALPKELVEEFEAKGVRYIRNLHGGGGAGPSWQQTYETEHKEEVEKFCDDHQIQYVWKPDGGLRLIQQGISTYVHPDTGEKVWFNQVDQFHPVHFEKEIYETLMMIYGNNEEELPMYGCFGDGSKIDEEMIRVVRKTVDDTSVSRPWKNGDLVLVDNVLVSHGRNPYKGERQVLVSML